MNDIFNPRRFYLLLRKTLLERPIQIFGLLVLNVIGTLLLYSILRKMGGWNAAQNLTFIWGFLFGGCYLSSTVFNYFSQSANGLSFLTLPASHFEKWLTAIIIAWVMYVIAFIGCYHVIDSISVHFYHAGLNPSDPDYKKLVDMVQPFDVFGNLARKTYLIFFISSASMLVGSLYFNKISFIKTSLLICAVLVGLYGLNWMIANQLFSHVTDAFPFSHVAIDVKQTTDPFAATETLRPRFDEARLELTGGFGSAVSFVLYYVLPSVLCITALIRLKEKEF